MTHMSFQLSDNLPLCSRCSGPLISACQMPQRDAFGRPITLELCEVCDTGNTAAGALLRFFTSGGGNETARAPEGAWLMVEFQKEVMAAHGYVLVEKPTAKPAYPRYSGGSPLGRG
ncbi:hypothetical protein J7I97_25075 [Streptomyces sp. ISL-87]|uniref:DUF6300 family protein n=1 Tax=Streptomyces sp. ISL-87 TaxID=2819188 RepID=UPI001BEA6EEC|nr:DUF6300 family protein [Streptomyces sp. ISL-87]MBT2611441.1 hypothetical protein [Streptomyces sp. ISL-87]